MSIRADLVGWASAQVGTLAGAGYDGPNPYSAALGRPPEAWCGDFVTDGFVHIGLPLPGMQAGCRTGFAYVPAALEYARLAGATRPSWEADLGDLALFDWNGDGVPDHVELVVGWMSDTSGRHTVIESVGGNSGPAGGVNRHDWTTGPPAGNRLILTTIDTSRLVTFGATPAAPPARGSAPTGPMWMLKTPYMTGPGVRALQTALNHVSAPQLIADGVYGPLTRDAVASFQQRDGLGVDGIAGPITLHALGLA